MIDGELAQLRAAASASFATEDGWRTNGNIPAQYPTKNNGPDPAGNACDGAGSPMNCKYGLSCSDSSDRTHVAFNSVNPCCWSCNGERRYKQVNHRISPRYQGCGFGPHLHNYDHTVQICRSRYINTELLCDNWDGRGLNGVSPSNFRNVAYPNATPP